MEEELRINAQKVSTETQYEIRKTIVRMLKNGIKGKDKLGVSEGHVSNVKKAYKLHGIEEIKSKPMGRKMGDKRILTSEQESKIQQIIVDKTPEQLKFIECMWTRKNIAALIKNYWGLKSNFLLWDIIWSVGDLVFSVLLSVPKSKIRSRLTSG